MDVVSKTDLHLPYSWEEINENDPKINGLPDETAFDRNEGNQVLYMINSVRRILRIEMDLQIEKIENLIRHSLPAEYKTQEAVRRWIISNF